MRHLFAFEWRYQTRSWAFAAAVLFFLVLGFALSATSFGPPELAINGPWSVTQSLGLLSLASVFALALFASRALQRDREHRMEEIVYSTSVTKLHYLGSRFLGMTLAAATAFGFALPGLLAGAFLLPHSPERLVAFAPLTYLQPYFVLTLPTLLFAAALLFAVAALTRSSLATAISAVAAYMLYFVAAAASSSPLMASSGPAAPGVLQWAALADPFGLSAFYEQTQYWTAAERNIRLVALQGSFLVNRLIWTTASLGLALLAYRAFDFRTPARRRRVAPPSQADASLGLAAPLLPTATARSGFVASWQALVSSSRLELRGTLLSRPFAVLLALLVGTFAMETVTYFGAAEFGSLLLPTTGLILGRIREPIELFGLLVVVFYSSELAWRERKVGLAEIVDATPAASGVRLLSKISVLATLLVLVMATAVVVSVLLQLARGVASFEPGLYASLLAFPGLPLLLVAVLALVLQSLAPHRHAGLLLVVVTLVFWHRGLFGPHHPLLRFAAAPELPYSAFDGFGPGVFSFAAFTAYWASVTALLAHVAVILWPRGEELSLRRRLRRALRETNGKALPGLLVLALLATGLGGWIFYEVNVRHLYRTPDETAAFRADYERAYRHLDDEPQPTLSRVEAAIALHPAERRYEIRGRYLLDNRRQQPIERLAVVLRRETSDLRLALDGRPASRQDERFGTYLFDLDPPLPPAGVAELTFSLEVVRKGIQAPSPDRDIVGNGSFLLSTFSFPSLGYRRSRELRDPHERKRQGLEERSRLRSHDAEELAGSHLRTTTFDVTVSTDEDQVPVAPGRLVDSWKEAGRSYARFAADEPVMPHLAFVSARYEIARRRAGDIGIELYHHPDHGTNAERFLEAAELALAYCQEQFGPYPYPSLRIVEVPAHGRGFAGLALPGIIFLVEDRGFLTDLRPGAGTDVVTKRVAHEVSHQWWGHQLAPLEAPGASLLVETLARYTEMRVLARRDGETSLTPLLATERDRYLQGRTRGSEVPLVQTESEPYLYYAKGAIVMAALHDLLGEDEINRTLRQLLEASADQPTPPGASDLVESLVAAASPADRALVRDLFEDVSLYDLRVESATASPIGDGRYRLRTELALGKVIVDGAVEHAAEIDELLDVGVFRRFPTPASVGEALLVKASPRIRGSRFELDLVVEELPAYVAIDPFFRRIDRNLADNVRGVVIVGGA